MYPVPMNIIIIHNTGAQPPHYLIAHLVMRWLDAGHQVVHHIGCENLSDADLVFLHVDKTVVPDRYIDCVSDYPVVINRRIRDISRSNYSQHRLAEGDDYDGLVIVKTNANYGGVPENIANKAAENRKMDWSTIQTINPIKYPVFNHIRHVPEQAWHNKHLFIERYYPEYENGLFHVRYWGFLGDKSYSGRIASKNPIVKFGNAVSVEKEIPVPDEIRQWKTALNMDYGRFDFVVHQGKSVLLDVNKTMGGSATMEGYKDQLDILASGIENYVK